MQLHVRGGHLTWRRVLVGSLLSLAVVGVVPPLRHAAAVVASRAVLFFATPFAPDISGFEDLPATTRLLAADGTVLANLDGGQNRKPVDLDEIPTHVSRAVLAAEDASFYQHSGVDPEAVLRALVNNARGNGLQGGSTISQQLAKLNYTGSSRTAFRKFREVLYASRLENRYSKDELLERYINQVYFGENAYGLAAAAWTFYGVPPEHLTPVQAAMLAGKIRAPERLDPYTRPREVERRRGQVLRSMREHGWLSPSELTAALASPLGVVPRQPAPAATARAPHFVELVKREAENVDALGASSAARRRQLFTGGYTITTTLDSRMFDAAVATVHGALGAATDPETALVSVQPGDGAVRVLYGGRDPNRRFDLASQGRRQPGSSFKPFVYLAALRAGIDPRTTFDSRSPKTVECNGRPWTARNYEGTGHGRISLDAAVADSVNTVFAEVMARTGPHSVARVAERAGISPAELADPGCAIALGGLTHGVTVLEQASAFAAFAAKGAYAEPYAIARIDDRRGDLVYERTPETREAVQAVEAGVLTAALENVVRTGTGRAAQIDRPVAGKTGTTENHGNAWFIGYVPQLATAVWVGYPDADLPMTDVHGEPVTGGSFPARIFSSYMRMALAGVPALPLHTASPDDLSLRSPVTATVAPVATPPDSPPATPPPTRVPPPAAPPAPSPAPTSPPPTTARATTTTTPAPVTTTTNPL
jgi:membrane peptidoglycan carboxypeptidase